MPDAPAKPNTQQRPGGPQRRRRQLSRYGTQMMEKQNLKAIFGVREEQLRKYYREAHDHKEETGPRLITLLELRLDNALYRAGFSPTRKASRQLASHRIVDVNGKPSTVPSMRLSEGDVVTIRANKRAGHLFENFSKMLENVQAPSWLLLDPAEFSFEVKGTPNAQEASLGVDVKAIVEYFAR